MSKDALIEAWVKRANKKYGDGVAATANARTDLSVDRIPSGSLELDLALGGGWPRSRISLVYGPKSSGKTTLMIMAAAETQDHCTNCHLRKVQCRCSDFVGGTAMVMDLEGTFDLDWAMKNGFDGRRHKIVRPEYGESAIDMVDTAIREKLFDLIIFDSIAACVPTCEIEQSAEDFIIGKHAIMMNKAFRKWGNALVTARREGPALLCINQPREKVGVIRGDTLTLPGGQGQWFANSLEIRLKIGKVHDVTGSANHAYIAITGTCPKNKTYIPKEEFEMHLALQDYEIYTAGTVNNVESIVKRAKKLGWVKAGGGRWKVFHPDNLTAPVADVGSKEEMYATLLDEVDLAQEIYDRVLAESLVK